MERNKEKDRYRDKKVVNRKLGLTPIIKPKKYIFLMLVE